jgi:membrane protein implicated in regulation of membrane protease activity
MEQQSKNVPFLSLARFGPGSIAILMLLALAAILLSFFALGYLALMFAVAFGIIFGVKSIEVLQLSSPEEKSFIGMKCCVIKSVSKGERGVVKVLNLDGTASAELWSAESDHSIAEGAFAVITGIRSIILTIEPIESDKDKNQRKLNPPQSSDGCDGRIAFSESGLNSIKVSI